MKSAIFLFIFVALALAGRDYNAEFQSWTRQFKKSYSAIEFPSRFSKWRRNLQFVEAHNNRGSNFTLSMNKFGDLSHSEFQNLYLSGLRMNLTQFRLGKPYVANPVRVNAASWDWRQKGAVTGVKNQGQCGACYTFSTTGSTEGCNFLKNGKLVSLSEQNIMDCSSSYGNQGCNGGLMTNSMDYIIANNGVDTESSYPYVAKQGTCHFQTANVGGHLTSYTNIPSGDETSLASSGQKGPVSVAIDASQNSFQFYTSGIYYEAACSSTNLDHGVLMVGAGSESDGNYWIVKNSWGPDWGLEGYIWMSKDRNNNCGIATAATLPIC